MKQHISTRNFVILALLVGIVLLMSWTPVGYLHLGVLEISFLVVPVAIAGVALGPWGGMIAGAVFGITSFLQCLGIGGTSPFGAALLNIQAFFAFLLCFVPRALDGLIVGLIHKLLAKHAPAAVSCGVAGFAAAFCNTVLFMSALILLFGSTDYIQRMIDGQNLLKFVCAFVGVNALAEMAASTILTCAIGTALTKAGLVGGKRR